LPALAMAGDRLLFVTHQDPDEARNRGVKDVQRSE